MIRATRARPRFPIVEPVLHVVDEPGENRFARDVHAGLRATPKALPSMYFYDAIGSDLFRRIMEVPEYYLTRSEREILERHGSDLASPFAGGAVDVVDLGAGDGVKTRVLFESLLRHNAKVRYFPVDVSVAALEELLQRLSVELPALHAEGVAAEYTNGIRWLSERAPDRRRFVLFLGSNVGNLDDATRRHFFSTLRGALRSGDYALVGFDLVKDPETLRRAYDDAAGVTAEFNLNLLRRINRELGADFRTSGFRHYATFSPQRSTMESHLLSLRKQTVRVEGVAYEFDPWEPMHVEISCKYRESDSADFAREAGFVEVARFFDERRWFMDALWRVPDAGTT
jgi:L-histidine Nalpha-methyltransferase